MKEKFLEGLAFIENVWEKLPSEVRVGIYWAGAIALTSIADSLLGKNQLDLGQVLRLFGANVILVFVKNLKDRSETVRNFLQK